MKKIVFGLFLTILLCPTANAFGLFFSKATHPLTATCVRSDCSCACMKCGEASSTNIFFLFDVGDGGVQAAAKDGCIKIINYVDVTEKSFLIFFRQLTTTVYGY